MSSVSIEERFPAPHVEQDMRHAVIRQAPKGRYAMYAGLTKLPDGEVLCVYKVGSLDAKGSPWTVRDETIVWTASRDKGRTWPGEERAIYANPTTRPENCCGTGHLAADGTVTHPFYVLNADYEERAQEQNWARLMLARSPDRGGSWRLEEARTPLALGVSFGGFVRLRDGTVLLNCYGEGRRATFRHEAWIMRSRDDGRTWGDPSPLGPTADPDHGPARLNETDVAELPDGALVSLSRTQYSDYPLWQGLSWDGGRTWELRQSGLHGLCPCLLVVPQGPPEGTLIAAYHDRYLEHASQGGMYLAFSTDGGRNWGVPVWFSGGAYPCMVLLDDGTVFCSYYASHDRLQGTYFRVPFPSGLRAESGTAGGGGVSLRWDAYTGAKAGAYEYRVHRSSEPGYAPSSKTVVGRVRAGSVYEDTAAAAERLWYYRVEAFEGETRVAGSWTAAARASRSATVRH